MTHAVRDAGPLVSIVIPVYNGSNYIAQAIDSALAQIYRNCEVIVVNDGSNDGGATERIVLSYGERVRYLVKENGGVGSALNLALAEMKGSLFSWLSHDDLYEPEKIERQCTFLCESGRDDLIVYSDYFIFSDDGRRSRVNIRQTAPESFRYRLARWSNVNGCTLLIPVRLMREAGGFNESLRATQDYDLWFRLARCASFAHINAALVGSRYHQHQGVFTQPRRVELECRALHAQFADALCDDEIPVLPGENLSSAYDELARSFWRRGFDEAAGIAQRRAAEHGASHLALLTTKVIGRAQYRLALLARRVFDPRVRVWMRNRLMTKSIDRCSTEGPSQWH